MAHRSPNKWYYCPVCDGRIFYGDEAPPSFCSTACENEWDLHYEVCAKCDGDFQRERMVKGPDDLWYCTSCFEDMEEAE